MKALCLLCGAERHTPSSDLCPPCRDALIAAPHADLLVGPETAQQVRVLIVDVARRLFAERRFKETRTP